MPLYINTNVASLVAQNNLSNSQAGLSTSLQRLSSGLRINSASDDAAGYSISTRMTSQINGLNQASQNANNGISLAQTAAGALTSVTANLQTLRQLAVESANATNTASDRTALNAQAQQLVAEIQNTATTTQFNGTNLLDGSFQAQQFQVGANANQTIAVSIAGATTASLGSTSETGIGVNGAVAAGLAAPGTINTPAAWTAGSTISINGVNIGSAVGFSVGDTDPTINAGVSATSAAAMANAINAQTSSTGVTATATTVVSAANVSGVVAPTVNKATTAGEFWINGIAIGAIAGGSSQQTQAQSAANAINAVSAQSGVTASVDASTSSLVLTASQGQDINLSTSTAGNGAVIAATGLSNAAINANAGTNAVITNGAVATQGVLTSGPNAGDLTAGSNTSGWVYQGTLTLNSTSSSINVEDVGTAGSTTAAGLTAATLSGSFNSLATMDISTVAGANAAITTLDAAISQVNSQQADLGAVQNRFTATISNLTTASTNLQAAQSGILDTNYASETANLAHYQILQQAGTAMLAQANSSPNTVLTLLR
jgi:flagellin